MKTKKQKTPKQKKEKKQDRKEEKKEQIPPQDSAIAVETHSF